VKPKSRLQAEIRQSRPFDSRAEEAGLSLMRTTDRLERRIAAVVEPHGITAQQYNVLRILRGSHPERLPTLEIAERMIEQAPGITRLLDRLEQKKLVERKRCDEDRRRVYCAITASGLALLAVLDEPVRAMVRASFRSLSEDQMKKLIQLLDRLREGLSDPPVHDPGDSR
jgi:DNA-binding MarR family transcriptional regulator